MPPAIFQLLRTLICTTSFICRQGLCRAGFSYRIWPFYRFEGIDQVAVNALPTSDIVWAIFADLIQLKNHRKSWNNSPSMTYSVPAACAIFAQLILPLKVMCQNTLFKIGCDCRSCKKLGSTKEGVHSDASLDSPLPLRRRLLDQRRSSPEELQAEDIVILDWQTIFGVDMYCSYNYRACSTSISVHVWSNASFPYSLFMARLYRIIARILSLIIDTCMNHIRFCIS